MTTTTINVTVRPEVARGAALLDELRPDWDAEIDLTTLHMNYCFACIVGQLFWRYRDGLGELGIGTSREEEDYGFYVDSQEDSEWAKLTEEWRELIASRR